jgi:hypothetical protein
MTTSPVYWIFHRTWWRKEGNRLVPHAGRKRHIGYAASVDEARETCRVWNANHPPGQLSNKAEFTEKGRRK